MCDYTQVQYKCSHLRYIVRAWCTKYQETHKRCPVNVIAIEYRQEDCGMSGRRQILGYHDFVTDIPRRLQTSFCWQNVCKMRTIP
ncbi:uncharacterized protein EI97DRAFT_262644 [Westerdykella ornata]|uniref:Uncharacterized protein n=1 Tax=Westerdykella ornata TaxID=318751 RepID=A0A6A6J4R7_WESOR|nr:uncharacterized protein EI97DRAFT_262644 [Westerdykella ornata]KAF2271571.1 hypothetical protein EI97DRAFT_262644 [Westerdykella ornata]